MFRPVCDILDVILQVGPLRLCGEVQTKSQQKIQVFHLELISLKNNQKITAFSLTIHQGPSGYLRLRFWL